MKKTFLIIIFLITVSLLGIIIIQVSWIKSIIKLREDQFAERVNMSLQQAAQKIVTINTDYLIQQKGIDFNLNPWLQDQDSKKNFLSQVSASQIFTIIQNALKANNITSNNFEFSVSCNSNGLRLFNNELHSSNFFALANTNVKRYRIPVIAQSGSQYEGLVSDGDINLIIPDEKKSVLKELGLMFFGAIVFTLIIIAAFTFTVRALLKQKKISEIKSDFINNMTHEFKTPIATISLAVDALKNNKVVGNPEKTNYFTSIIKDENKRMNKQVEAILQAAILDKQELQLNKKRLDLNAIVQDSYEHFAITLQSNNGTAEINLSAVPTIILADEVHITNLVRNLMDNAIKYVKQDQTLHLKVTTAIVKKMVTLTVQDNGIGMTKETQQRIFEKFYRAHTGNVHNVKGFGLGLTYVKGVVDAHQGTVKVDSTLGKGSTFIVQLPYTA